MKKLLLSFSILCIFFQMSAQWTIVSVGTTQDLYSVDYYSSNDIWIGSFNQFVKTTTGGASWTVVNPLKDLSSASILPANVNDLALTSPTNAIATGLYFMGNTEVILRTTNSGANWDYATFNNSVPLLRYINSLDMNGTRILGVGNTGRIFRSTDSGASWVLTASGTTSLINDVKFTSFDTVFASGTNVMLRSYNGGASWAILAVSGDYVNLACKGNVVYATQSFGSTMLKSTDYGVSYSSVNLPFVSRGAIHAVSKDTVIASGSDGLYISRDGGAYWEKYVLSSYGVIEMLDFLTPYNGFAVGQGGYTLRTSNLNAALSAPIAMFTIQGGGTSFCLNDSLTFLNTTAPLTGYTYQWKLDGATFSIAYGSGKKLTASGSHTISLIVSNGSGSDTASVTVNVTGHDMNPLTVTASADSVCSGTFIGLSVPASETGVNYQLRNGFVNIGAVQAGTGSTLNFAPPSPVTGTVTYNIKAVKTTFCFTDSLTQSKTIYVNSPTIGIAAACVTNNNYCPSEGITNVTFGAINNTTSTLFDNYFDYTCSQHSNVILGNTYPISITVLNSFGENVKVWIDYNNDGAFSVAEVAISGFANPTFTGNITIPSTTLFNQKIRMRVASDYDIGGLSTACLISSFYCGQAEDYALTVLPAPVPPTSNFTYTTTVDCALQVTFSNSSYNALSYLWDFGDGSPTSTLYNPAHAYTLDGTFNISLVTCNPTGCDTLMQTISVTNPVVPVASSCNPTLGVCSDRPTITYLQEPEGQWMFLNTFVTDLTCTRQFSYVKDSLYTFFLDGNDESNYFVMALDANSDGLYAYPSEYLFPFGQNISLVSSGTSIVYASFPLSAPDSVPLRMRMATSKNFITNICSISCGDYKDFTVFLSPHPLETFFSTSTATVCTPDSATVNFVNNSKGEVSWLWDFGDGGTSTLETPSHVYTSYGIFSVKLKIWAANGDVDSLIRTNYITINPALPVPVITRAGNVLSTVAVAPSYQWYRNGILISGATGTSYTVPIDGNYTVVITNTNGCTTTSAVYPYFPPNVNFTMSPTSGCVPVMTSFSNTSTNCTTYTINWGDGSALYTYSGAGGPIHTYTSVGVYTVKLVGCGALGCDSLIRISYINMSTSPAAPVITFIGGQLTTPSGATTYQWYLNGGIIAGATSNIHTPLVDGNYTVTITNAGGCSATSAIYAHFPVVSAFNADTLSYCGVTSANVSFTNTSSNASTYSWHFGDGGTSTLVSPSHNYTSAGSYTVKLVACGALCDSITFTNYIVIDPVPFNVSITPAAPPVFCGGTFVTLTGTYTPGTTYQWQYLGVDISGETDTIHMGGNDGDYNLVATNLSGCIATSNIATLVADWYCVWPGDTDFSYEVDNYDILPIGLFYGQIGVARATVDNTWDAFPSTDWGIVQASFVDIKHIDCNGDGTIDDNDTLAVNQNFTSIHAFAPPPVTAVRTINPDLYCVTSASAYFAGDWVNVDVMVGNSIEPVVDLYGIGFNLYFDNYLVEPGTGSIIFSDSWLTDSGADGLSIGKVDMPLSTARFGVTRKSHTSKSGYGKLATFRFQAATNIMSTETMSFSVIQNYGTDETGTGLWFDQSIFHTIDLFPLATTIHETNASADINVYPNPFTDKIAISYSLKEKSEVQIEVYNSIGQRIETLITGEKNEGKHECIFSPGKNVHDAGIYFVKIIINGEISMRRIIEIK